MLTIEVRLNGRLVATAKLVNQTNLSEISDYSLVWDKQQEDNLRITGDAGLTSIEGHRRRQTVWALVAKAAAAILGQKLERMERKG